MLWRHHLLFVGAIKTFLSVHTKMSVCRRETNFFSDKFLSLSLNDYRSMMPNSTADQIKLEGSPSYFSHPHVPRRVHTSLPGVKLLLVACDPSDRVLSQYVHAVAHESPSLKKLGYPPVEKYIFHANGSVNPNRSEIIKGHYAYHLNNWLKFFPLSRIHVIDGYVLKTRPWEEFERLGSFLNLSIKRILDKNSFEWNNTRHFYCHRSVGCLVSGKGREHPSLEATYMKKLREYFRPKNRDFFEIVGRKFDWP